jgi:hypothetical protein
MVFTPPPEQVHASTKRTVAPTAQPRPDDGQLRLLFKLLVLLAITGYWLVWLVGPVSIPSLPPHTQAPAPHRTETDQWQALDASLGQLVFVFLLVYRPADHVLTGQATRGVGGANTADGRAGRRLAATEHGSRNAPGQG